MGSIFKRCYFQNRVIMNSDINRFVCTDKICRCLSVALDLFIHDQQQYFSRLFTLVQENKCRRILPSASSGRSYKFSETLPSTGKQVQGDVTSSNEEQVQGDLTFSTSSGRAYL